MTVKDANNHFYSYWASEVTDPSATMQSYRMAEYKKDLSVLEENDNKLHRDDIKEVTMTTDASTNSATIGLVRNGNTEAGALKARILLLRFLMIQLIRPLLLALR